MNVFNMNINLTDIHAGHFLDGACHLLLNVAPYFANVDFFFHDNENVGHDHVFMDCDLYAIIRAALEETIDASNNRRHFTYARYAEGSHTRNGDQYFGSNRSLAGWTSIVCHSFFPY